MSEDFGTKLSRWSQRKQAARRGVLEDEAADSRRPDEQTAAGPSAADASGVPASEAADETPALPPVEELTAESDYTVFLGQSVPEVLKRAALRKLWRSDPVLANLDGLNDYDEDFNTLETLADTVRSAYRAGKGYAEETEEKLARLESGGEESVDGESVPGAPESEDGAATRNQSENKKNDGVVDGADAALRQGYASE